MQIYHKDCIIIQKFGEGKIFLFVWKVSYAHHVFIYLIKNESEIAI